MILFKTENNFSLNNIDYEIMNLIIRGLKSQKIRLQNNINLLTIEIITETCENNISDKKSQIDYFTDLRNEIDKTINDYENN
jgi:hypothetical protein